MADLVRTESDQEPGQTEQTSPGVKPGRRKLSRSLLNLWLDGALLVAVLVLVWTSLILRMAFPPPTAARGWKLWGLSYDQWYDLQFSALCVSALLALEHVVLHWNWICSVIAAQVLRVRNRPDEGSQAIYGVGTFIVILIVLLGSLLAAQVAVHRASY